MAENDPDARPIGERTFTAEDQERFARISGDRNPMHMDAVAARRLVTGRPVVHGIHLLIAAIEHWRSEGAASIAAIDCTFNNPVNVGDTVHYIQSSPEPGRHAIEARVNGLLCAQIALVVAGSGARAAAAGALHGTPAGDASPASPLDEAPGSHVGKRYRVRLNVADTAADYPRARAILGRHVFAAVAASSYFVGMVCPGLHSIFSSLTLELAQDDPDSAGLTFSVRKYDHRVRLFDIGFEGCIRGGIKAFLRPPPQVQPSVAELREHVTPGEFAGTRSLIVGGSRGLGEMTAKLLAAGGGDVIVTYASGVDDAARLSAEINSSGGGRCEALRADLKADAWESLAIDWAALDAAYFFATPRIYRKKAGAFEPVLLAEFCDFYVTKFYELCAHFEARTARDKVRVFFPSSVFVVDRPKGMTEYAMAKAAAEVLVEDINRTFRKVTVVSARLPRLRTDQTASILALSTESNLQALLPCIRSMTGSR